MDFEMLNERNAAALTRREKVRRQSGVLPMALPDLLRMPFYAGTFEIRSPTGARFVMLLCDGDDGVALRAFWNGFYEPMTSALVSVLASKAEIVVDVGAHTGYFTLLAHAANPNVRTFSFEPNPMNFARAMTNCRLNDLKGAVISQLALSDEEGSAQLATTNAPPAHYHPTGGHVVSGTKQGLAIRTVPLDLVAKRFGAPIGLIKCDVEGYEPKVLAGSRSVIEEQRPDFLLECFEETASQDIATALIPYGYRFHALDDDARTIEPIFDLTRRPDATSEGRRNVYATCRGTEDTNMLIAGALAAARS